MNRRVFFRLLGAAGLGVVVSASAPLGAVQCLPDATGEAGVQLQALAEDLMDCAACAPAYFAEMTERPPELCLDSNPLAPRGTYEPERHRITLNANLSVGQQLLVALHEVRHLDQMARGLCPSPQMSQEAYVSATLALEADAMANAIALAWQLSSSGRQDVWSATETIEKYDDLAGAFGKKMDDGATLPAAVSAAYRQWFASPWRVETYRNAACMAQLDRRDAQNLLPLYTPLPQSFFAALCILPDGRPYACQPPG